MEHFPVEKRVLYEDNHLIAVLKASGETVQGDKSGDEPLLDAVKYFIKMRDRKPGNVFLGIPHRLDRPTSGVILFAKTGKALARINEQFKQKQVGKVYWAAVDSMPPEEAGRLEHHLSRNTKLNKSFALEKPGKKTKSAALSYRVIAATDNYYLLEIRPETGRHHQIRAQLAAVGCHIKGDLKYGAARSNPNGGIHLHARSLRFIHPVKKEEVDITADPPADDNLWRVFIQMAGDR
jgi:23S rRNA pseudouridine1911/1915/1917 synthase